MRLSAGAHLGTYTVLAPLGAGGMGEVYRARDRKLDRDVAIKVLSASLAHDPGMLVRFEREAKALAALSHPHVLGVFDYGRDGDDWYVVTELLEGETLRARLEQAAADSVRGGRLPAARTLEWAVAIAQGLAAAHAKGLIHRDLKPDNVFLTTDGVVKILDFGLARLPAADPLSATRTPVSSAGLVVGSAPYMSPEQAQGHPVDHRSDLFSFGAMLYELLTGRHPFRSGSPLQTMQRVIEADVPPLTTLAPDLPIELDWIVRKALAKDPAERYQSSADLVVDLQRVRRQIDSGISAPASGSHAAATAVLQRSHRRWLPPLVAGLVVLTLGAAAWFLRGSVVQAPAPPPISIRPLTSSGNVIDAAISPDGKYLAYVESFEGHHGLWLKQVATGSVIELVKPASVGYWGITFAPDGASVYYALKTNEPGGGAGTLYRVPTLGGAPRELLTGIDSVVSFSPDGSRISYLRVEFPARGESSVMIASADGSEARALATRKSPQAFAPGFFLSTAWSPDGTRVYAPLRDLGKLLMRIVALDAATGEEQPFTFPENRFLQIGGMHTLPDGALLFVGSLKEGPGSRLGAGNEQVWLLPLGSDEPRPITNDLSGYRAPHATPDGRMLTAVSATAVSSVWEVGLDGRDRRRVLSVRGDSLTTLSITRTGRLLFRSIEGGKADIWAMNGDGGDRRQLTTAGLNSFPVATPDERAIVYLAGGASGINLWRMDADGRNPRQLSPMALQWAPSVSPDGRWVVFTSNARGTPTLWRVPIEGGTPVQLTTGISVKPAVSPDGRWIALFYQRTASSTTELAIVPFDGGEPVQTFKANPSTIAVIRWSPDGRSLLHTGGGSRQVLYVQPLDGSPARTLVSYPEEQIFGFDITADGRLFLARGLLSRDAVLITDFR